MLRGERIGLRAVEDSDIEVFETELLNDVGTRSRADNRPWRPVAPGSPRSPYRATDDRADVVQFAAVELATSELVGEALLWGIDLHNRSAHVGISLRPAFRGKGTGHRHRPRALPLRLRGPRAAPAASRYPRRQPRDDRGRHRAGFVLEGNQRQAAWVNGSFADEVILGQLAPE